jgi:hypothetical protein
VIVAAPLTLRQGADHPTLATGDPTGPTSALRLCGRAYKLVNACCTARFTGDHRDNDGRFRLWGPPMRVSGVSWLPCHDRLKITNFSGGQIGKNLRAGPFLRNPSSTTIVRKTAVDICIPLKDYRRYSDDLKTAEP